MLKFDYYHYKDENDTKLSLDWFVFEDHWFQRYMFDRPMWNDEMMETMKVNNEKRHKRFKIILNIFSHKFSLEIKLKHIGNVYHGRKMEDGPKPSPLKRKKTDV